MNPPPLPKTTRRIDLPADMASHVTTPRMRVLGVVAFCILTYAQFHLYRDALAPVMLGDAVFVLDADGPRLDDEHDFDARVSADSVTEVAQQLLFGPPIRPKFMPIEDHDHMIHTLEF